MKRYIHSIGLVLGATLMALSQLQGVVPSDTLRGASAILGFIVAIFTDLDKVVNPPAPPAAVALLAALCLGAGACPHPGPGPGIPAPVVDVAVCAKNSAAVQNLLSEVTSALASGDFVAQLTAIGERVGWAILDCTVAEVEKLVQGQLKAVPGEKTAQTELAHAQAWLSRK